MYTVKELSTTFFYSSLSVKQRQRLRKYISAKYPTKPQKLIFANIFIARIKSASYLFAQPNNVQEKLGITEKW